MHVGGGSARGACVRVRDIRACVCMPCLKDYRGVAVSSREGSKHSPPCFLVS